MYNIPIIAYHKISNEKEFGLTTITIDNFERQIDTILSNGYTPITFKKLKENNNLPKKPIIITFDDGYESVYTNAFPILQKHNATAVVFIIANYMGKINKWEALERQRRFKHLSKKQIIELCNYGFEIGSHGLSHKYLPFYADHIVYEEVFESKNILECITGESVISFCYPYGRYNNRVFNIVQKAGYSHATCNIKFFNKNNAFTLYRRSIYSSDKNSTLINKINHPYSYNYAYLNEWVIQRGALASIALNIFKKSTPEV